jgi:hypothetical protein
MPESLQLPILGPGIDGRSRAVSAQKRQNLFMEEKPEADKTRLAAYGTPGLKPFSNLGEIPARGLWWFQAVNFLYAVSGTKFYEVRGDGTFTERGTLNTSAGIVSMADNGLQLMIVDGGNGYVYTPETADLAYTRTGTTVKVTEVLQTRRNGDVVEIQGDAHIPSGTYTISVPSIAATAMVATTEYVITSVGTSDFTLVGATLNQVGIVFSATAATAGTGTVVNANEWRITTTTSGSATGSIKVVNNFRDVTDAYTGVNFPGANTIAFIDSYFVINVPDTKQFWLSAPYDAFSWDPLQFASKEAYTDTLQAVTVDNGNIMLLGAISQEYWQDDGGFPFPFSRIAGSPTDTGVIARWSIARCEGSVFYLGRARRGGISVIRIQNYQPQVVSPPDLDFLIAQYANPQDAVAFSYRLNGHDFYQISFQEEAVSWLYDATTNAWSVMTSGTDSRHYGNLAAQYNNNIIVSDYRNGNLYTLDAETYTDNGDVIMRELITPHFFAPTSFNKYHVYRLRLDMQQGTGLPTGQGQQPQIMLQVSRDGGFNYGNEMWTTFGAQGDYLRRAEWRRLGVSRSYVFKFRITDPVKVIIMSASAYATMADK